MRNSKIIICATCIGLWALFSVGCKYDKIVPVRPVGVSFQNDIIPIFNEGCNASGCHSGNNDFAPDLSPANAYSSLIDGNYINVVTPENSPLYRWMAGEEKITMPPGGVNPEYNLAVLTWIQEGAEDN